MKRHVNLMSSGARVRTMVRTRILQWSLTLALATTLLTPLLFAAWWPVQQATKQVTVLEAQYEPIRQLKAASRSSQKQIEDLLAKEQTSLALAKIDTPVVALLGLVGKVVSETQQQVVVEKIDFSQNTTLHNAATTNTAPSLKIDGYALDDNAINQFTSSLQTAFHFGKVELKFSAPEEIRALQLHRFTILCSF